MLGFLMENLVKIVFYSKAPKKYSVLINRKHKEHKIKAIEEQCVSPSEGLNLNGKVKVTSTTGRKGPRGFRVG
jgi:hypothetical protein